MLSSIFVEKKETGAMYVFLLIVHSIFRWIVLVALIVSIYRACIGYFKNKPFTNSDNSLRHWTATIGHIQLIVGVILYIKSPISHFFWANQNSTLQDAFFPVIHAILMTVAIVVLTIGSALAKRKTTSIEKYKTVLLWFSLSMLIIVIAIPWPFSPLSSRPYIRF